MKKNETVTCYGYYTDVSGTKWLLVVYKGTTGFASSKYLKKEIGGSTMKYYLGKGTEFKKRRMQRIQDD